MPDFDGSEKIISRGAQAVVYHWQGFAYKVYPDQYPKEWIKHELQVQDVVSKLSLPVVKYEQTDDPCVIRMDFIDGLTLADRIRQDGYKQGVEDMIKLQMSILQHQDLPLPDLKQYARYDLGLLDALRQYGEPHLIGSYRMDIMASNDLDIDVRNDRMSLERLYDLTSYILTTFNPCWYEAKEEQTEAGKTVWFHGFEARILGDLWNVDIWFFDDETIARAERYCDDLGEKVRSDPSLRDVTIAIKQDLLEKGLYGFGKHTSMDVYRAVFDLGVRSIDAFFKHVAR